MKPSLRSGFGGVWPVVQRELREGARRPFNHWLRVGSALAGLVILYTNLSAFGRNIPAALVGANLFSSLHRLLLFLIFCIVPAMAADCISKEKRDGTLGLLFLTGLTPAGIVVGKGLVQAFRAFTLWVAVLPVLTIPFLTGGVTWGSTINAVTIEFCATVLCLAGGLLASAFAKSRGSAFALALSFAIAFAAIAGMVTPYRFTPWMMPFRTGAGYFAVLYGPTPRFAGPRPMVSFVSGPGRMAAYRFSGNGFTSYYMGMSPFRGSLVPLVAPILLSLLIFLLVIRIAARRVDLSWQDKPPSPKRESFVRRYLQPARGFSEWKRSRALDRNPIAWLQEYSWKARLSKWGLCVAFVVLEFFFISGRNFQQMELSQGFLVLILAGVFTFAGVNSFIEEKKSGALELVLITPLKAEQIIFGRSLGLWKQFLPALIVLVGFYVVAMTGESNTRYGYYNYYSPIVERLMPLWIVMNGYLVLPVVATYFALRVRNLIFAGALTWLALFLAPVMGAGALDEIHWRLGLKDSVDSVFWGVAIGNICFAGLVCFLLRHSLSRRIYSF